MLKKWIAYYLFLFATITFALLYPGAVSSTLFYAALLLPLTSLLLLAVMLAGFKCEQRLERAAATKGDRVGLVVTAVNRGPVMLPFVEAVFHGGDGPLGRDAEPRRLSVPAFGSSTLTIGLECRYRGAYDVGLKQIRIQDYLGLFTIRKDIASIGTLTVCPRVLPISFYPVRSGYEEGPRPQALRRHDLSGNISDIRKFAAGDRLRSVHWKLSAKKEELLVKNFEQTSGAYANLVLDTSAGTENDDAALVLEDRLVECAVALANHFSACSIPSSVIFYGNGLVRQSLDNRSGFQVVYRMLSEVPFGRDNPLPDLTALASEEGNKPGTTVVVTASLTPELCGQALKLRGAGCDVDILLVEGGDGVPREGSDDLADSIRQAGIALCRIAPEETVTSALTRRECS